MAQIVNRRKLLPTKGRTLTVEKIEKCHDLIHQNRE